MLIVRISALGTAQQFTDWTSFNTALAAVQANPMNSTLCQQPVLTIIEGVLNGSFGFVPQPRSPVFVFTDSSAFDYDLERPLLLMGINANIQLELHFILTGNCPNDLGTPQYGVYQQLSSATQGLTIQTSKDSVGQVTLDVMHSSRAAPLRRAPSFPRSSNSFRSS